MAPPRSPTRLSSLTPVPPPVSTTCATSRAETAAVMAAINRSPAAATSASASAYFSITRSDIRHLVDALQGRLIDLIRIETPHVLGEALAGLPARQRNQRVRVPGPGQRRGDA